MKEILNPNCSEVVFRLHAWNKSQKMSVMTDSFPNGCLDDMLDFLSEVKADGGKMKDVVLEYVDNNGGGGNYDYVEKVFKIAKKVVRKKITREEAQLKDEKKWGL